jgi:hypothetical protein
MEMTLTYMVYSAISWIAPVLMVTWTKLTQEEMITKE